MGLFEDARSIKGGQGYASGLSGWRYLEVGAMRNRSGAWIRIEVEGNNNSLIGGWVGG